MKYRTGSQRIFKDRTCTHDTMFSKPDKRLLECYTRFKVLLLRSTTDPQYDHLIPHCAIVWTEDPIQDDESLQYKSILAVLHGSLI
ncbi:hypothetical protein HZH66_014069 [Vespula vulgaris]|uniref:Uncharacterized protein n=1 Tax=Vespula vulgaris TaxID=7454 RepID=A0A834MQR8_VESVU|nr:hypothetical protein HZH66_014069 [Vespula vulgaris]